MKKLNTELEVIQLSQVIEQLEEYDTEAMVNIYNQYAGMNRYEMIYDNDEDTINELFDKAWTAISLSNHDGYKDNDSYFTYNGYGLMSSFNYVSDDNCPVDISELAEWLINEDKLADYDIEVVTLDDMLASIEDNITDDENMLNKLVCYLGLSIMLDDSYKISESLDEISDYDYNQLKDIINYLGINYQ